MLDELQNCRWFGTPWRCDIADLFGHLDGHNMAFSLHIICNGHFKISCVVYTEFLYIYVNEGDRVLMKILRHITPLCGCKYCTKLMSPMASISHTVFTRSCCALCRRTLRWRHNDCDGVSNHQPHDCLLKRLFRRISKKTSKLRVTGLCEGN